MSLVLTQGVHRPECDFLARSVFNYLSRSMSHYKGLVFFDLRTVRDPYRTMKLIDENIKPKLILDLHDDYDDDQILFIEITIPQELNDIGKKLMDLNLVDVVFDLDPNDKTIRDIYKTKNYPKSYGSMEIFCNKDRSEELKAFKRLEKIVSILYESLNQ